MIHTEHIHQANSDLDRRISEAIARQLPPHQMRLTLADMALLAQYAQATAESCHIALVFSFVEATGQQRYFFSMDGALLISHRLATQKAWTAVALKMPTADLATQVQPGASLYGLQNEPGICCFGGGLPCWSGNVLLGAIGISGGTVAEDIAMAGATMARFSVERFPLTVFPSLGG